MSVTSTATTRRTIQLPIDEGVVGLRGLSPQRHRFELEYALERGSTANSVLFEAADGTPAVLVHPPGVAYSAAFLPVLAEALPSSDAPLLVVVGHVNPNRVALLRDLAEAYTGLELIVSNPGAKLIEELWSQRKPAPPGETSEQPPLPGLPPLRVIRQEQTLPLSHQRSLMLLPAPTPRWPGGLLAFEESLGLLMSDKFFSAHLCTDSWAESNRSSTEEERRHFYDCLMAPMARQVDALVERLEELDIRTIAPCHGPAIEASWRSLLNDYRRWGEGQQNASLTVALLFASAYGNTAAIADALARGVSRTGIRVSSLNCEFTPADELVSTIQQADAVLIGSPTLGGHAPTPIVSALGTVLAEGDRSKPVGVFGSFGWSGEAVDLLETKLRDGGFSFGFEPIRVKFSPDAARVKELEETGTRFARQLLQSQKRAQRRSAGGLSESRSDPAVLALGRVIGSLCVLTTRKAELSGAMVASWVSQASFSPPGITVAVAKDRAVEALLHKGDRFALNVLAEGRETALMKQFLQPFEPGADRFAGLELDTSPAEQPLLPDALAWLDGKVSQRMECGDHWLIYAEVDRGGVLDAEGSTAVHQRRSGANY
ncbi:diflavin flavoprotein [Synechococcus sp. N32]|uniref:diflavin flavoprotein n=1 Tax=Synechococcus sp. N32 TaxID=2575514 RepID=UPI000E0EAD2B|nr:diflavin flavoprotein [Synechococcus sp. N32]